MATKKSKQKSESKGGSSAKAKPASKKSGAAKRAGSMAKAKSSQKAGGARTTQSGAKKGGTAKRATVTLPAGNPLAAAAKFERDLQIRGEALPLDESGHLPLDATHEVVKGDEGEPAKIERRRFKMF